ncbi:hypothetical protein [Paenibacillus cymbidii]|uniref:hypothetical protein n=1 Tax=Paenibacillus cymbidii TaxID=1639034 RepID=UPI001081FA62|nr:hypothetical protein [Paenibacillus cymbidii]
MVRVRNEFAAASIVLRYAEQELIETWDRLEQEALLSDVESDEWVFELKIDAYMEPFSFAVTTQLENDRTFRVQLTGADGACVLHAVYTMFEQAGICYDISDTMISAHFSLNNLLGFSILVNPSVQRRGIRQHINFPMDISSYPLAEAKRYIRQLARLKYNHITFHSYPGQWYEFVDRGDDVKAGQFFYGQEHAIPAAHPIRNSIRNESMYCIPELESLFIGRSDEHTGAALSQAAIHWLQQVMEEAKKTGMQVQFSIELRREKPGDLLFADCYAKCLAALAQYPLIDVFEIITSECGGNEYLEYAASVAKVRELANQLFGSYLVDELELASDLKDAYVQTPGIMSQISLALKITEKLLNAGLERLPLIALGVYATEHAALRVAHKLLTRLAPPEISFAFLPAHGAREVVESLEQMALEPEHLQRMMIYSWCEFDGNMYLQQNPLTGIYRLIELIQLSGSKGRVAGVVFNHWRTAENRIAINYAAALCNDHTLTPDRFYAAFTQSMGMEAAESFIRAIKDLDDVDHRVRKELPNVGFCFVACWFSAGLGSIHWWSLNKVIEIKLEYHRIHKQLSACLEGRSSSSGTSLIKFLLNRIMCTVHHLEAIESLVPLAVICSGKSPYSLNEEDQSVVRKACDRASEKIELYMQLHAADLPDRGCEGTLISYFHTLPVVVKKIRKEYGTSEQTEETAKHRGSAGDPPPPAIF